MKGLIIKEKWLNKIFYENKIWEIRSSNTNIRGKIYLIQSGTKHIYGEAQLIDSIELTPMDLEDNKSLHKIDDLSIIKYDKSHAWVLSEVKVYENPIPYIHPKGAIIWVNI